MKIPKSAESYSRCMKLLQISLIVTVGLILLFMNIYVEAHVDLCEPSLGIEIEMHKERERERKEQIEQDRWNNPNRDENERQEYARDVEHGCRSC